MKFTSFNALRDNETLRMNVTGLTTEFKALSEQNKYLRGREDELRARVAEDQIAARGDLRVSATKTGTAASSRTTDRTTTAGTDTR